MGTPSSLPQSSPAVTHRPGSSLLLLPKRSAAASIHLALMSTLNPTSPLSKSIMGRIRRACDRCRSKKLRCDGLAPSCTNCREFHVRCIISNKAIRNKNTTSYSSFLEQRIRTLEAETQALKDQLEQRTSKVESKTADSNVESHDNGVTGSHRSCDKKSFFTLQQVKRQSAHGTSAGSQYLIGRPWALRVLSLRFLTTCRVLESESLGKKIVEADISTNPQPFKLCSRLCRVR